ncbi:TetR/AcrR family transcriptional regulator [Streptomyces sp. ME19-03-3]|nr:TetR/AcrR family transcriptional regulator [Streptomyces sp. ME19-03-3]
MDRVIAESEVAKSTLYVRFPAKDGLAAAYLHRVDESWRGEPCTPALAAGDDPQGWLVVVLFAAVSAFYERHGFHGCPFANAAGESEPGSSPHEVTVEHQRTVRAWVREPAEEAGAAATDSLPLRLTLLIDGTLDAGRLEQNPAIPAAAKAVPLAVVEQACPPAA